jgi:hypothetical protein
MLLSASENSITSMPSPVYQCKKARRLYIAENCTVVLGVRLAEAWVKVTHRFKSALENILYGRGVAQRHGSLRNTGG